MKELRKPHRLRKGGTVAAISLSGGRAGDADMLWRYELGKKRLEEEFGLRDEMGREDLPVLMNVDFCHRTPMTVLLVGAMAEIDCGSGSFAVLESGTV